MKVASILFAVPDRCSTSQLNTEIQRWLDEVGMSGYDFTVNKNLNKYPIETRDSYWEWGDKEIARTTDETESVDKVLETIKLYLSEKTVPETVKELVVKEEEVVAPEVPNNTAGMAVKVSNVDVVDFVNEAMFSLSQLSVDEQNQAMEELYKKVQESRVSRVEQLEEDIDHVKESSHNLHEIFSRFKPKWAKPRK